MSKARIAPRTAARHAARLNLRASKRQKRLYEIVAERQGMTVTDFILDCADRKAEEMLADQRHFTLSAGRWKEFCAALDRPAKVVPRLRELFAQRTVLDR